MDKKRIVKFLDSLEERGIMAADQQSFVLRPIEEDAVGGSNKGGCKNSLYESCGGSNTFNEKCINEGIACSGSLNDGCTNKPASIFDTNKSTVDCKSGNGG